MPKTALEVEQSRREQKSSDAVDVMCGGQWLMRERSLLRLDDYVEL